MKLKSKLVVDLTNEEIRSEIDSRSDTQEFEYSSLLVELLISKLEKMGFECIEAVPTASHRQALKIGDLTYLVDKRVNQVDLFEEQAAIQKQLNKLAFVQANPENYCVLPFCEAQKMTTRSCHGWFDSIDKLQTAIQQADSSSWILKDGNVIGKVVHCFPVTDRKPDHLTNYFVVVEKMEMEE